MDGDLACRHGRKQLQADEECKAADQGMLCITQHKRGQIHVHSLDIPANPARRIADSDRTCAAKCFQQFLALGCQHLPEKFRRGERNPVRSRALTGFPDLSKFSQRFGRGPNIKSHGLHG